MWKQMMAALLGILLLFGNAWAADVTVKDVTTAIGENHVSYPQLSGMADEKLQSRINDDVVLRSDVSGHLMTLITLGSSGTGLQVDYRAAIVDDVFSVVISAKGKLPKVRDGHVYTALSYDLATGERLTLADLFTDVELAVSQMEEMAENSLSEEWSEYSEYCDIKPLPRDSFTLDDAGITFWYPSQQFRTQSGMAGAVQFRYEELDGLWKKTKAESLPDSEWKQRISQSVQDGIIPHLDVKMGQTMNELADAFHLLRTPDAFPGGRYYLFEDPAFRDICILSDVLYTNPDDSVVEGIQMRRGGLHGLVVGKALRDTWLGMLGNPEQSFRLSESMAFDYGLPVGSCDLYRFGQNELRLYADENGTLCAIQLSR